MKVLFFGAEYSADHSDAKLLNRYGFELLFSKELAHGMKLLSENSESLDLLIIQREDEKKLRTPGLEFVDKFKRNKNYSELPYILTSSVWENREFVSHQNTPIGANAYLHTPIKPDDLLTTINTILGTQLKYQAEPEAKPSTQKDQTGPLEPIENLYPEFLDQTRTTIRFEQPGEDLGIQFEDIQMPPTSHAVPSPRQPEKTALGLSKQSQTTADYRAPITAHPLPIGDALIPGGTVRSPDLDTLKSYLLLREQDVAVLTRQLSLARDQNHEQESKLNEFQGRCQELEAILKQKDLVIKDLEQGRTLMTAGLEQENLDLRHQIRAKNDRIHILETKSKELQSEVIRIREKVILDTQKIRHREKELENKLELLKKDAESLIKSRENKITELKRKTDLLEFNLELSQDQLTRERNSHQKLREKLQSAKESLKAAGGFLDEDQQVQLDPHTRPRQDPKQEKAAS